ncbi:MAG: hypothetical protein LCH39_14000 [Proteobacteria bacterium]|nr:hypothetical protein [Pseudomonadota bacterium]
MSDDNTPPSGRARGRKAKAAPEMDLSASDVREVSVETPATEAVSDVVAAEAPAQPEPVGEPAAQAEPEKPAEPTPEEPAPSAPPPAASPSRAVPALLGLVAGLIGGVGGATLAPQLGSLMGTAPARIDSAVTERLAKAEEALSGFKAREDALRAEIASLGSKLSGEGESARKALQTLESKAVSLAQQASPDIDALKGRLGKLEGEAQVVPKEIGALGSKVGTLQPKLETLEKTVETLNSRVAAVGAKDALALANGRLAAQSLLEEAFQSAKPYAEPLDLITRTGGNPVLIGLAKPFAETGAPSAKTLRDEFVALKPKAPVAPASEGGFMDRAKKAALSLVEVRQVGDVTGKGDEAVLARVDQALVRGDLATAFSASAALSPAATPVYAPWRARLEARIKAGEAVVQLRKDAQVTLARAAASAK